MSNFAKIVILFILVLSFFFIKEKCGDVIGKVFNNINMPKVEIPVKSDDNKKSNDKEEVVKAPTEVIKEDKKEKEQADIYFLALDSNSNGIYKKVQRDVPEGEDKFDFAVKELLKGPNLVEKSLGAYSEIPDKTKLLGINKNKNRIIIDLSSDFQYGGGTDSIYSRMMQLIKTSLTNTKSKKIYLYLDGKQINSIGGEGIMISQPLTEKSLD